MPRRVILESPYRGDVETNRDYARRALRDSLLRGEAPLASHLLYTQVLDDTVPVERQAGMAAGWAWIGQAECMVFYVDLGMSDGMHQARVIADQHGVPIEYREINEIET